MKSLGNKAVSFLMVATILTASVPFMVSCSQHGQTGAAIGGGLGAAAGALLDEDNRWRGAVIGGAIGSIFGGTLAEISHQAAVEAAREGKPVVYESENGYRRVEATPVDYNQQTKCHKVRERVWEDGKLVKDQIREVCESEKTESTY